MELQLHKPIIFFDLETTGIMVATDRIVEISMLKVMPDGREISRTLRINPGMPIPPEVTAIHGISDEDVKDEPSFADVAHDINQFIGSADLGGYNAIKFDIPLLIEEFNRVGIEFDMDKRRIVDVQNIFHKMEQRTLRAAYQFYCDKELVDAHSAEADTRATYEVLLAMLDRYDGAEYTDKAGKTSQPVQNDVGKLHEFSASSRNADLAGHIVFNDKKEMCFNFGKHKGKKVTDVFSKEPSYYDWMMNAQFPVLTKRLITRIRLGMKNNPTS